MSKNWVERVLNRLVEIRLVTGWKRGWKGQKMAEHLIVSTIAHSESVFLGHNVFLNELELDSFFFGPKWECFGQQHCILPLGSSPPPSHLRD